MRRKTNTDQPSFVEAAILAVPAVIPVVIVVFASSWLFDPPVWVIVLSL